MSTGCRCAFIAALTLLPPGVELAMGAQSRRPPAPMAPSPESPAEPIEGRVEVPGKGKDPDMYPVCGTADCVGFGPVPGVQCQLDVRWPTLPSVDGP